MITLRKLSCALAAILLLCFACACQQTPDQVTLQVVDAEGTPLPNIQVSYGISNPETFADIGFTDEEGYVVWKNPPVGEQDIYMWRKNTADPQPDPHSDPNPGPQYIPLKIRRADFGATITLQAEWTKEDA